MRPRAIALTTALGYAAFLVLTVPASWVAARVSAATGGRVELSDAQGTLWTGSARAIVASAAGQWPLERLRWRFTPAELAAGRIAFDFTAAASGLEATARVGRGFSDWMLGPASAVVDARLAAATFPLLAAWHPEGRVRLASDGLRWSESGQASGTARITWDGAAVAFSAVKPLGRYAIDIAANQGPANLTVTTIEGPLRIMGRGALTPPGRFTFSGEARADAAAGQSLDPLLDLLGPRRADGTRAIEVRLSL